MARRQNPSTCCLRRRRVRTGSEPRPLAQGLAPHHVVDGPSVSARIGQGQRAVELGPVEARRPAAPACSRTPTPVRPASAGWPPGPPRRGRASPRPPARRRPARGGLRSRRSPPRAAVSVPLIRSLSRSASRLAGEREDRHHQRLLGGEVAVERPSAQPGPAEDLVDGEALPTPPLQHRAGRLDQGGSPPASPRPARVDRPGRGPFRLRCRTRHSTAQTAPVSGLVRDRSRTARRSAYRATPARGSWPSCATDGPGPLVEGQADLVQPPASARHWVGLQVGERDIGEPPVTHPAPGTPSPSGRPPTIGRAPRHPARWGRHGRCSSFGCSG